MPLATILLTTARQAGLTTIVINRGPAGADGADGGDYLDLATYDPLGAAADVFDMDNMVEGAANKILTAAERAAIAANTAKVGVTSEEANPDVVPQAEAEAGVATTERTWTAQRVSQAISALAAAGGDMLAATYDPTATQGDVFDMENMAEGATAKVMTATERTNIAGALQRAGGTMTGIVALPDGSAGTATGALYFSGDTDNGIARIGANEWVLFAGGSATQFLIKDLAGTSQIGYSASPMTRVASTGEVYEAMQAFSGASRGIRLGDAAASVYVRAGSVTPTQPVFKVQNSAGTQVAGIDYLGNIKLADLGGIKTATDQWAMQIGTGGTTIYFGGQATTSAVLGGNNDTLVECNTATSQIFHFIEDTPRLTVAAAGITVGGAINIAGATIAGDGVGGGNEGLLLTPDGTGKVTATSEVEAVAFKSNLLRSGSQGYIGIGYELGSRLIQLDSSGLKISVPATFTFNWSSTSNTNSAKDLILSRDAANTLAQRNGTAAQTSRIYGTYTDASNYARLAISTDTSGNATIATEAAGTGSRGSVSLNGTNRAALVADASDLATAITLVNAIKVAAISHGLMSAT